MGKSYKCLLSNYLLSSVRDGHYRQFRYYRDGRLQSPLLEGTNVLGWSPMMSGVDGQHDWNCMNRWVVEYFFEAVHPFWGVTCKLSKRGRWDSSSDTSSSWSGTLVELVDWLLWVVLGGLPRLLCVWTGGVSFPRDQLMRLLRTL